MALFSLQRPKMFMGFFHFSEKKSQGMGLTLQRSYILLLAQ